MKLFFNYSIDCELPPHSEYTGPERRPFFHGPETWEFEEASVRGFVENMDNLGVRAGATLFVYPDVARHQKSIYRELADAGVEVALHLNGLRYSGLQGDAAKWLGGMTYAEQKEAIRMGKEDLEDTMGAPCAGYRACYGSGNNDTLRICDEVGFEWASNASRRYRPEFCANWSGSWPYGHRGHRDSNLIPGDLKLYEIPCTAGLHTVFDGNPDQPFDLRVETSPDTLGEEREVMRSVIDENIIEMERRNQPVRTIIGASHNTSLYGDLSTYQAQNLVWCVRHAKELTQQHGLEFTPASFAEMKTEADRVAAW